MTNAQVAAVYQSLWTPNGVTKNTYVQAFAVALGIYADTSTLGGNSTAQSFGFKVDAAGGGPATFNVGSNGAAFGVANNATTVGVERAAGSGRELQPIERQLLRQQPDSDERCQQRREWNQYDRRYHQHAGVVCRRRDVGLHSGRRSEPPTASAVSREDGTGQTIAIVVAYDDPSIYQAVDAFDLQFGLTDSGPSLAAQYGPATSFLTVVNQSGQTTRCRGPTRAGRAPATGRSRRRSTSNGPTRSPPGRRSSWSKPTANRSPT